MDRLLIIRSAVRARPGEPIKSSSYEVPAKSKKFHVEAM